jgi:glycosyltransferase involved in cell wall biosynthesis
LRRLALVGPVAPFRGGIAQHTTQLHRELSQACELLTISFRRLYPSTLYPGADQRDLEVPPEPSGLPLIDALDPRTWRAAAACIRAWGPDALLVPWWTAPLAPLTWSLTRMVDVPVVFICHNVMDHDAPRFRRRVSQSVLTKGEGHVVHSAFEAARLGDIVPGARAVVAPMPAHGDFESSADVTLPRSGDLELLFFGFVRPYKGVDVLLDALSALLRRDPSRRVHVTIAGEVWGDQGTLPAQVSRLGLADSVELRLGFVAGPQVGPLFRRADVVVLPYRSATDSGVIPLAYRHGKPVLVTRVGGLPEAVREGETGWIVPPESPSAMSRCLADITADGARAMAPAIREFTEARSWGGYVQSVLQAVDEAQTRRKAGRDPKAGA